MKAKDTGFERVEDLLLNAQRRALQERFDDAVGRMYRAIELTAQIWLEASRGILTGDVNCALVPESKRADFERARDHDGRIKIGLLAAWDLVAAFENNPPGTLFTEQRARVLDFLKVRNDSLFAHGVRPISKADYQKHVPPMMEFLRGCIDAAIVAQNLQRAVVLEQLPTGFLDE